MIRLRGVTKSYTTEERIVHALQEIELDVPQGQFLAILGRSSADIDAAEQVEKR